MTAVMDRRKSLGLGKSSNRPRTTFKEEDEHQDDIYGARSRDVRNIEIYLPVYCQVFCYFITIKSTLFTT